MHAFKGNSLAVAIVTILAAPTALAQCQMPYNQMPNCAFTSNIANWNNTNAAGASHGFVGHSTFVGNEALGALTFNAQFVAGSPGYRANAARCIAPTNAPAYLAASVAVRLTTFAPGVVDCRLNLSRFASADCTGSISAATQASFGVNPTFVRISAAPLLLGSSASVKLDITCGGDTFEGFNGVADDVLLTDDVIFADRFE